MGLRWVVRGEGGNGVGQREVIQGGYLSDCIQEKLVRVGGSDQAGQTIQVGWAAPYMQGQCLRLVEIKRRIMDSAS